ncbi:hypothetical protein AN964_03475 [Heyndrickxia shackletonii]|uniref:Uncharacterized protein n=1 Tax=Heyndrickxia shackletonii TaxID=157838 RepID=A0A0Q3WVF7_9BACI|nr:hypothetical protein [Heyndrickxia shackletonii]KQL52676.1 hypothetical protein AN964_03475 [Heyndrickxia shackletonii]NEZ01703.1 hypothetical protein [Heyndrickxia shackletonii]
MHKKFFNFIDNEKKLYIAAFFILILSVIVAKFTSFGATILGYIILGLIYTHIIRRSVKKAKNIFLIILWLVFIPLFISIIPLAILSIFIKGIFATPISTPLYILFFILIWTIAVFIFDYYKIKVAIQFINALVLTILGITFVVYFTPNFTNLLIDSEMKKEIISNGLGVESFFDLIVKMITLPYFLACLWSNFAIEVRGYFMEKNSGNK